jgi:hypothetical protein
MGRVEFTVGPNTVTLNIYRCKYILFEIRSTSSKQFYAIVYLSVFLSVCSFYGTIYYNLDNYFKLFIEKIFFNHKIIPHDNFCSQKKFNTNNDFLFSKQYSFPFSSKLILK